MGTLALFYIKLKILIDLKNRISLIYNHDRIFQLSIEGEMEELVNKIYIDFII